MNRIAFLSAGVAASHRARARIQRHGCVPSGHLLWTAPELETLRRLYPDYQAVVRALDGKRTYRGVRAKAQQLGLAPKRQAWTGEQVLRLRKVYRHGTTEEVRAAFPHRSLANIAAMAQYFGLRRPKKPFKTTGHLVIDQIRQRCFELRLSMKDLDEMAGTKSYFSNGGWHCGGLSVRAVARAVKALDGQLAVQWNDDEDESVRPTLALASTTQAQPLAA